MAEEELRYSAGSIMLQVIPSLRDAQRKIGKDAKDFGDAMEKGIGEGMEKGAGRGEKAVKESLNKSSSHAKKAGAKAGDDFASAYQRTVLPGLEKAVQSIGKTTDVELLKIKNRMKQLARDLPRVGLDIDSTDFDRELRRATGDLLRFSALSPTSKLRVDSGQAHAEMAGALKELNKLDGQTAHIDVDLRGAGSAAAEMKRLQNEARKTKRDADDTGNAFRAFNGILLTTAALGPAVVPVLAAIAGGLLALGPAAAAGVAGIGIAAIGLSGISDAVSALNDAQDSATKDNIAAARAMRNARQGVLDAGKGLQRARQDAATSAEEASRRVTRAEEDAARSTEQAAQRVQRAKESAARANEAAARRQVAAENRLRDSQKDALKAQVELAEARKQAAKELDDIADRARRNELDRRQAVIDLFNATVENNAAQADPGATTLDREQASINLGNAQQRLKELRDEQNDIAEEKTKGDLEGINGTEKVQNAQERLTEALEAQKDAQQAVRDAAADTRQTQIDGARDVADAIADQQRAQQDGAEAVADAERARAQQAESSRRSIEDAQLSLARANQAYADALYDTGEQGSTAMQKVKDAMGKLGPEGKAFAIFIAGLRDDFYEIRNVVAAGMLPGLQQAIESIMSGAGPGFTKFLSDMATAIGDLALSFSSSLQGPAWQGFFQTMADFGPKFLDTYGEAFISWLEAGASLMTITAPLALAFANGFKNIADNVARFMASPAAQKLVDQFFGWLVENAPAIEDFFVQLGRAVLNLMIALAPVGLGILKALTSFFEFLADMDPENLRLLAIAVTSIVVGFQVLAAILGPLMAFIGIIEFLGLTAGLVVAAIGAVVLVLVLLYTKSETARKIIDAVLKGIWGYLQFVFGVLLPGIFRSVGLAFELLGKFLQPVWEILIKPLFDRFAAVASWLWTNVLGPVFGFIGRAFSALATGFKYAWDYILAPVFKVFGIIAWNLWNLGLRVVFAAIKAGWDLLFAGMKWAYEHTLKPLVDRFVELMGGKEGLKAKFDAVMTGIGKAWDRLKELAKGPIDFVVNTVINGGLIKGFNALADLMPGMDHITPIPWPPPGWNGPTKMAKKAKGTYYNGGVTGVMPGYTPGRDVFEIAVSGGEAVMRPEWTRAIKSMDPGYIDEANRRARLGGVQGVRKFLGGYREGGEVKTSASDYGRTMFRGEPLNYRTIKMIMAAENLLKQTFRITQGSFQPRTSYSGSTHMGGGVFDTGGPTSRAAETALRRAGFAAWIRTPAQGNWARHIHAVAIGDRTASRSAQQQVEAYLRGGDGLGGKDTGAKVDIDQKALLGKFLSTFGGGAAGLLAKALADPTKHLLSQIAGPLKEMNDKFGGSVITQFATSAANKLVGGLSDKLSGFIPGGGGSSSDIKQLVQGMAAAQYDWGTGANWKALEWLVNKESSFNPTAQNPSSSAYGLFQFLDSTWSSVGGSKTSDPREQTRLGLAYIAQRYGSPTAAMAFHRNYGWYKDGGEVPEAPIADAIGSVPTGLYDDGGLLPPGLSAALNLTGANEHKAVFTTEQWEALKMQSRSGGGSTTINVPMQPTNSKPEDVAAAIAFEQRKVRKSGRYARAGAPK